MNVTINTDKLGKFHSCDRETYKKLRKVRFFLHVDRIQRSRKLRWASKLPHNRVRWVFDGYFEANALDLSFTKWKAVPWEEPEQCPINLNILQSEFNNAKIRHDDPSKVIPMKLDEAGLDAMIAHLYAWSDRAYGRRS